MRSEPNRSALVGALIIEELARLGVRHVVIAPGSRSSPLVVAAARHAGIEARIHIDERGAAFRALGIARSTGRPAAVITTSGTAVANLLPAAVEAAMDHVPLVLLTADRPPELHDVGANQAIAQHDLFRPFSRGFATLPPMGDDGDAHAILETVDALFCAATGERPGPVQLNVQFREPLAPTAETWDHACLDGVADWLEDASPLTPLASAPAETLRVDKLVDALAGAKRPLLVLGTLDQAGTAAARTLADALGWAVYADVRSGLRIGRPSASFLPHLDRVLAADGEAPDTILQLGGRLTSKDMARQFARNAHNAYVLVDPRAPRADPAHHVTHHTTDDPARIARALTIRANALRGAPPPSWTRDAARVEDALVTAIDQHPDLTEPYGARRLLADVPKDQGVFISSSMAIRDVQAFARVEGAPCAVAANRGASGIDGIVSTALGYAEGRGTPTTLFIGDLALIHDLNALAACAHASAPLRIVVSNNGGGSIFSRLPIAEHEAVFSPWFDTPHAFRFEGVAAQFGIDYRRVETKAAFDAALAKTEGRTAMIEIASDLAANEAHHARIDAAVVEALS